MVPFDIQLMIWVVPRIRIPKVWEDYAASIFSGEICTVH